MADAPPLLALSVMQPWARLIVAHGKDVENRTWRTPFRGRFLIHAGKRPDRDAPPWWRLPGLAAPPPPLGPLDFGGIVGEAELVDVVTASASPWFAGPFGFVLRNARPLPFRACRGALGFFRPLYQGGEAPPAAEPPRLLL